MDKNFFMGSDDWLIRSQIKGNTQTIISDKLHDSLIMQAIKKAYTLYEDFFNTSIFNVNIKSHAFEYKKEYSHAISLGLFQKGSISEKDHLNLWCLNHIYLPEIYIESGVFIGSSLHAFINSPQLKKIIAIDPDLKKLKIPNLPNLHNLETFFIDNQDFSQLDFDFTNSKSLAFFDDHIDSADRILQSSLKGLKYAIFDDSTGIEGTCQRFYPAIPTIPMIINAELFSPGDYLSWCTCNTRMTLSINQEFLDKCFEAKKRIIKCMQLPNLGEFIPQQYPSNIPDTTKYLIELDPS